MRIIIDTSEAHGVIVIESPDWQGVPRYVVVYGLEATHHDTLTAALSRYRDCLAHAIPHDE